MHFPRPLIIAIAVASIAAPSAQAAPSVQQRIYDPLCVSKIGLTAPQESIDALYADPKGEYQPATMTFDLCGEGTEIFGPSPVTFRLKGSGSFRTLDGKAAFKVKMPSGSRIDGLKSFTLNNMVQDPSMVHEALAYDAFRAAGIPSPRSGYATVILNGADYGLHANVETPDSRFLAEHFASTQHLYEQPDWLEGHSTFESRDVLPANVPEFEVDEGDDDDLSDLEALAGVSMIEDDEDWWTAFQDAYHVERVLRFWAVEAYVGNEDGYSYGVNNFYLHSTADGEFSFLPWGLDRSFTTDLPLGLGSRPGVVAKRCGEHPACSEQYAMALDGVDGDVRDLALAGRAKAIHAAIADAVAADTRRETSLLQQCIAVNQTIEFISGRDGVDEDSVDCSAFATPVENEPPAAPNPAADTTAPRILGLSARRVGHGRFRLHVRAADDTGVSTVQIRTRGGHLVTRAYPPSHRLTITTWGKSVRVRVIDAAGNSGRWRTLTLPR